MKRKTLFIFLTFLSIGLASSAQNFGTKINANSNAIDNDTTGDAQPKGIIYDTGEESDSALTGQVFIFQPTVRDVKIRRVAHPSVDPTGVELFNAVHRFDGDYYLDRGELGLTHLSLFPYLESAISIATLFQKDANPVFHKKLHLQRLFQTLKPYTQLSYGSSMNKDYQIGIVHTQNIIPRWNIALLYNLVSRDGLYTNSDVTDHILDATTNYYSADARYQLQAGVRWTSLRQQENGGVQNDSDCWGYSRSSGVPVNMYTGQNLWRDIDIFLHQSYNTTRQQDSVNAITPHIANSGVVALDMNFSRHRRKFYDTDASSWFYGQGTLDTTFYLDSNVHYKLAAELYWTNDAYMSHRWGNPFVITIGIRPEYNRLHFEFDSSDFTAPLVALFANARLKYKSILIEASAEELNGSHLTGDYRIMTHISTHGFNLSLLSEALSPEMMFYHHSGVYNWNISYYDKTKRQYAALEYTLPAVSDTAFLQSVKTRLSSTLLSNNVWIGSDMKPHQGNTSGHLTQLHCSAHMRLGWLNLRLQEMVQYSDNSEVMRVPIFASKNSIYADFHLFKRALQMQTGIDLRFHTRYQADGWNPVLGTFYRQDDTEVGGYLVADFWVTLQIKRASIYVKASHFNAALDELTGATPSWFSLPHYPMEGLGVYWGVIWKFFD